MSHTLTGNVQSGQSDVPLSFTAVEVTLFDATVGDPREIGRATTGFAGSFSIDVPYSDAEGIFYASAAWGDGVRLVTVIGPAIRGPIVLDELTTVAAAYALAQFTDGGRIIGSPFALRIAAGMCDNLVSPLSGQPSPVMLNAPNADQTNSLRSIRTLGNLIAPVLRNIAGAWDAVRGLATPPGGDPPADTFQALWNIARYPAENVGGIYTQAQALEVYTPPLATPPDAAWTLAVKVNRTGDDHYRMFGGPANIAWDRNGYAWVANNVIQGTSGSADFVVVLKPNGMPSDGTGGAPVSPVVDDGMVGPGFGIAIGPHGDEAWVGSFGWGPSSTFPTQGIASKFRADGSLVANYLEGTVRIQGVAVDKGGNVWLASYGTNAVVVYPKGVAEDWISYPEPNSRIAPPGNCTFGIAMDPTEDGCAWVTYSGGLGWPHAYPGHVARFRYDGVSLTCTFHREVGLAVKGNAVDSHGNVWIASGGDSTVYMMEPDGRLSGFSDRGGLLGPWGLAIDGDGDVWVANFGRMGVTENYTNAAISRLAGVDSPSGRDVGEALTPDLGYTLPTAGDPVTLPDGSLLYDHGEECKSPLMRMTSVTIDAAGNIWAVNNWKPRFGTDFPPTHGNPGGDGIVIFVGLARPPVTPA